MYHETLLYTCHALLHGVTHTREYTLYSFSEVYHHTHIVFSYSEHIKSIQKEHNGEGVQYNICKPMAIHLRRTPLEKKGLYKSIL